MTDPELDDAIDRAARDLMNVDADPAFRSRVAARLQRPARRMLFPGAVTVLTSAAVLTLTILWIRPLPPQTQPSAAVTRTAPSSPAKHVRTSGPELAASQLPDIPARPRVRIAARRAAAATIPPGMLVATVAEAPTSIAPLAAIDPITVDPISRDSIVTSEIVVAPLSPIAELQISPLEPPVARN